MGNVPRRILVSGLICIAVLAVPRGAGAVQPDSAVQASRDIADAVLAGDYRQAEDIAGRFRDVNPGHPAGSLMLASVIQYEAIDYEDFSRGGDFEELLGETERLADERLADDSDDLWAHYYRAAAYGLAGSWSSITGSVLTGIIRGRSGAVQMDRIIDADSTFFDAYLLWGSYHFWKSVATRRIAWLPFIEDEKEQGIDEVTTAIRRGMMTGPLSNTVLLEMLLEDDPRRALDLSVELTGRYPGCRLFAWQRGEAAKKLGMFDEACSVFSAIAEEMRDDPADDGSGELSCWWKLAVLAFDLDDRSRCADYCRRVIDIGESPSVDARQRERIERARELLRECGDERD